MLDFKNKNVIITGATGGIGHELALKMAKLGATLSIIDIDKTALDSLQQKLAAIPVKVNSYCLDIRNYNECAKTIEKIGAENGGIDVLVNCAGIYPETLVKDMGIEQWKQLMQVNLDGTFNLCKNAILFLNDNSAIINLSSMAGHRGSHSHAHYSASKGAVTSFSKSLALELAPKTRVNIVAPGIIQTAMTSNLLKDKGNYLLNATPLKRFGTAAEIADVIIFLGSDMASFITGETIHANGGLYIV